MKKIYNVLTLAALSLYTLNLSAQDGSGADNLAKQLQNPVANLISVPFQANYDLNVGPNDGTKFLTNVQPVIPISISENWNLIGRAILPIIKQCDVNGNSGKQSGLGDAVISGFFSPKAPTKGGLIWGVGPVILAPTATKDELGLDKFGLGPTAVALKQMNSVTIGCLVNHIWSVGGKGNTDVNATFFQPFIAKNFSGGYALAFNTELTQNWDYDATSGTFHIVASKVVSFGSQMTQIFAGPRIHYGNGNPAEWGIRAGITLLFPTKS